MDLFNKKNKKLLVILILVLVVIVLVIFFVFVKGGDDNKTAGGKTSSAKLVTCTATSSTQPSKYTGWSTSMVAVSLAEKSPNYGIADNGDRNFSVKALGDKTSPSTIYYITRKTDESHIPGTKFVMEICDSNNKSVNYYTTATTVTTPSSEEAIGVTEYLHSGRTLPAAGSGYRIDGYLYADSSWHFTDRITGVTFTD